MKRLLSTPLALLLTMTALPALASNGQNSYARTDEPHATLRFDGGLKVKGLIPLYLLRINGEVTLKKDTDFVYLKPGSYKLAFRAPGIRNRGTIPDAPAVIPGTTTWRETDDTIDRTLKAGTVYYIAGKPHGNGAWTAIVWKRQSRNGM